MKTDKQRQNRISADAKRMGADEPRWVGTGQMGVKRIVGTWNGSRGPGTDCGDVKWIEGMWNGCGGVKWVVGTWNGSWGGETAWNGSWGLGTDCGGVKWIVGVWNG